VLFLFFILYFRFRLFISFFNWRWRRPHDSMQVQQPTTHFPSTCEEWEHDRQQTTTTTTAKNTARTQRKRKNRSDNDTGATYSTEEAIKMLGWEGVNWDDVVREIDETTYSAEEAITLLGWEEVDWDKVVRETSTH
jgi:hypothetical protein